MGFFDTLKGLFNLESFYTEPESHSLNPGQEVSVVAATDVASEVAPAEAALHGVQAVPDAALKEKTLSDESPIIAQGETPASGKEGGFRQFGPGVRQAAIRGLGSVAAARQQGEVRPTQFDSQAGVVEQPSPPSQPSAPVHEPRNRYGPILKAA